MLYYVCTYLLFLMCIQERQNHRPLLLFCCINKIMLCYVMYVHTSCSRCVYKNSRIISHHIFSAVFINLCYVMYVNTCCSKCVNKISRIISHHFFSAVCIKLCYVMYEHTCCSRCVYKNSRIISHHIFSAVFIKLCYVMLCMYIPVVPDV